MNAQHCDGLLAQCSVGLWSARISLFLSMVRAGCKKTLSLLHYPHKNLNKVYSFNHSLSISIMNFWLPHPPPRPDDPSSIDSSQPKGQRLFGFGGLLFFFLFFFYVNPNSGIILGDEGHFITEKDSCPNLQH